MNFEWDPVKSDSNHRKRGFGFAFASRIFEGSVWENVDVRRDYRETRVRALGEIEGRLYVVVYTDRLQARRIISARPASKKERTQWLSSEWAPSKRGRKG